jgi:transposase
MQKTFKYRIYPSKAQVRKLDRSLALCCELYDAALQERRDAWRISRTSINYHAQAVQLPEIKTIRPELGAVHSQVLQETLKRLDKAFDAFFRRVRSGEKPGFPRFRSQHRYDSLTYPQTGFGIEHGKLRLSKIGRIKIKLHHFGRYSGPCAGSKRADVQDRDGAKIVLKPLKEKHWRLKKIWADQGYRVQIIEWVKNLRKGRGHRRLEMEIVAKSEDGNFGILPKRSIVERTFGWLGRSRRLSKDFEALCESVEAWILIAMIYLMTKRLVSHQ